MKTIEILGSEYPVMRELAGGWHLIAHPNGPAVAIQYPGGGSRMATICRQHPEGQDGVPAAVQYAAREAYLQLSWPKIKPEYYPA